ncbi:MAG: MATE family efflux transporter, partial [Planctomycetota bacterium]
MSAPALAPNSAKPVRPLWELLVLAGPTVAQMLSYTLMQFTDTVMLSRVGDLEALAAANAGGLAAALTGLGFGAMWLVNTLVSQSFGRGDYARCGRYLWQGVWLGVIFGAVVGPLAFIGGPVMTLLDHEPALVKMEATYLWIVLPFTVLKLVGLAGGQFLLAIGRPNRTLLAALFGVAVNIVANYALIFGNLGCPALGLVGAAWGTVIGQLAEAALLWVFVLSPKIRAKFGVLDWKPRRAPFGQLLRLGLPSGMQMTADVTAWTLFSFGVM